VTVCPVDCFYIAKNPSPELPDQLYISPEECIDCRACIPECPWEAIYEDIDLPELFKSDIALNAKSDQDRSLFLPAQEDSNPNPTEDEVIANKRKWGLEE
jgi:ferredoxin